MLHWFADLMNVTEEVTIHRPNVSTLLSSAFLVEKSSGLFLSASLSDEGGLTVGVADLINCYLSILRFVLVFDVCW